MTLPSGTVTFAFTDIEGSTRLLQELGDEYGDVVSAHRRIIREAFGEHGGTRASPRSATRATSAWTSSAPHASARPVTAARSSSRRPRARYSGTGCPTA